MGKLFTLLQLLSISISVVLFFSNITQGQVEAWQFGNPASTGSEVTYNATTNDANLNVSVLSRGTGLTATALARGFSSTNFTASGTKADAITNNKYFAFNITANSSYKVSLSTLDVSLRRSSTGPDTYIWQYSKDGSSFTDIGTEISFTGTVDGVPQTQVILTGISALQNVASGTTIYFRLYAWGATATGGTFAIGRYAAGITTNSLAIGGSVTATSSSTFSLTGSLTSFSQTSVTPSAEQTYNISGTGLTTNVTLVPPSGFEISKTTGLGFVNSTGSLVYTSAEVMAGKTIYVRLNSVSQGIYSGSITHTSAGSDFAPVNQSVSGTNTSPFILTLTAFLEGCTNSTGTAMRNDHNPITVTVQLHGSSAPYALVESQTGVLSSAGVGTFNFSTAVNSTLYYIVVKSANSVETWSASPHSFISGSLSYNFSTAAGQAYGNNLVKKGSSTWCIYSGDVTKDAANIVDASDMIAVDNDNSIGASNPVTDMTGDGIVDASDLMIVDNNNTYAITFAAPSGIPTAVLSISGTLSSFSQTSATASAEETYNISGSNLTANVTLVPPAGFEISKTTGSGFVTSAGSLVYTSAEVMAGKTIYVRLHAGSPGSYSGNITHTSSNAEFAQVTKSVSGNYTITPVLTINGALSSFSQTSSTPSAEQTYTISGTNLSANVTLAPPADFEISKTTGSGFVTSSGSLVFTAAEVMAGKTIYVRMNAPSAGNYSGSISHTSAGAEFSVRNQSVSGLYSVLSLNVNLTMGNPSGATVDINFPHNYLLDKPQFCASYDRDRGIPNWTSWQLNSAWCNGPGVRTDPYGPDLTLPAGWHRVGGNDYSGSGFARGHMCPSADRINTQANNDALFVMTNLIPQNQDNNAGAWEGLESYERVLANAGNTLYIISGGYGAGGKAPGSSTVVSTISSGQVTVPAQLWKVIIVVPPGSGSDVSRVTTSTRTIAMLFNNDSVANTASLWGNYRVSVASIEALTGYTFFSNVPSSIANVIKGTVDSGPTN
jgi:endonuclease G, mitochondrial